MRTYSELITFPTLEERFEYLKLSGTIGFKTFGLDRYLNQMFYHLPEWKATRNDVLIRDGGYDLGVRNFPIKGLINVHHLNPITKEQILDRDPWLFDLENLISSSDRTHKAIHYGSAALLPQDYVPRTPFDTCPWRT